jgi:hypothetical protein
MLLHLSFNQKLEGVWKPRVPDGSFDIVTVMSEPLYPRISVAPTVEKCFWGIYPNVSKFFEKRKLPYMVMMVYTPRLKSNTKLVKNEDIVKDRLVHDAHMTEESFILTPVYMERTQLVKIYNCLNNPEVYYYPFNDKEKQRKFLSYEITFDVLEQY